MKKYILVNVVERDIYLLGVFDTLEQAQHKMKEDFVNILAKEKEDLLYDIDENEYQAFLNDNSQTIWLGEGLKFDNKTAYITGFNCEYDWEIFEREI